MSINLLSVLFMYDKLLFKSVLPADYSYRPDFIVISLICSFFDFLHSFLFQFSSILRVMLNKYYRWICFNFDFISSCCIIGWWWFLGFILLIYSICKSIYYLVLHLFSSFSFIYYFIRIILSNTISSFPSIFIIKINSISHFFSMQHHLLCMPLSI